MAASMKLRRLRVLILFCLHLPTFATNQNPLFSKIRSLFHNRGSDDIDRNYHHDSDLEKTMLELFGSSKSTAREKTSSQSDRSVGGVLGASRDKGMSSQNEALQQIVVGIAQGLISYGFLYMSVRLITRAVAAASDKLTQIVRSNSNMTEEVSGKITKYLQPNCTISSHELEILGSAVTNPEDIDVDLADMGGLDYLKQSIGDLMQLSLLQAGSRLPVVNSNRRNHEAFELSRIKGKEDTAQTVVDTERMGSSADFFALNPIHGVLLYGPPGCGKSALISALCKSVGLPVINVSPGTLLRKYVGETSQMTAALFSLAEKLSPCVMFVDEMDALFRARVADDHSVDRNLKLEFTQLWDKLIRSGQSVMVIGATNRPQDLDAAIQRRFERSYLVGMPSLSDRAAIFRKLLRPHQQRSHNSHNTNTTTTATANGDSAPPKVATAAAAAAAAADDSNSSGSPLVEKGFDFEHCARITEGYTASDIVALCKAAIFIPLQEQLQEVKEARIRGKPLPPRRPLTKSDMDQAIKSVRPTMWMAGAYQQQPTPGTTAAASSPSASASQQLNEEVHEVEEEVEDGVFEDDEEDDEDDWDT